MYISLAIALVLKSVYHHLTNSYLNRFSPKNKQCGVIDIRRTKLVLKGGSRIAKWVCVYAQHFLVFDTAEMSLYKHYIIYYPIGKDH